MTRSRCSRLHLRIVLALLVITASVATGCAEALRPNVGVNFAGQPDGPVAERADTGQRWIQTANRPAALATIVNGRFTNLDTESGRSAAYMTAHLSGSVSFAQAEFEFGPTGTDDANVTLIASATPFPGGDQGIGTVPDMAMHVAFRPNGWTWSTAEGHTGELKLVESITYPEPVPAKQVVVVTMDTDTGTARIRGADGVITTIASPAIGSVPSPYFTAEIYYHHADVARRVEVIDVLAQSPTPATTSSGSPA